MPLPCQMIKQLQTMTQSTIYCLNLDFEQSIFTASIFKASLFLLESTTFDIRSRREMH